ncbi:MAG: tyrosine-type recombinase/integrase [Eubacterium sp.]
MKKNANCLEQDIEKFLSFQISLGYQRNSYESQLRSFADYVLELYPETDIISKAIVMEYLEQQTSDLHRKASVLRLFAQYLNAVGKEAYVLPTEMFRTPTAQEPYIFSDQELKNLFSEIDRINPERGWIASVAPVLFRLIYTCGLRPKEGRELRRNWINFETGEIRIEKSKGKKDRTVVMSDDMLALCRKFDKKRTDALINSEYFFARPDGDPFAEFMIHQTFISCWKKSAGLGSHDRYPRSIRVYSLRHRFATAVIHRWLDEKRDLRNKLPYLQEYMGHTRLNETVYYLHLLPENLLTSAGIDWNSFDGLIPEVWK